MISPLRRRHRRMVTALAVVLPVLFVAGLLVRRPPPVTQVVPAALTPSPAGFPVVLFEDSTHWGGLPLVNRLRADRAPPARLAIEVQPVEDLKTPDLLVYWHPGAAPTDGSLPEGVYLLGTLAGTQARLFALPDTALRADGHLLLFSLAHQRLLATASLSSRQP